jgi:hypothetical protein
VATGVQLSYMESVAHLVRRTSNLIEPGATKIQQLRVDSTLPSVVKLRRAGSIRPCFLGNLPPHLLPTPMISEKISLYVRVCTYVCVWCVVSWLCVVCVCVVSLPGTRNLWYLK